MTTKSQDEKVQSFLEDLERFNAEKYEMLSPMREIVFARHPDACERIIYGGIMFSLKEDFGGLFVYKKHISFEFVEGVRMDDPEKLLEGKGKFRRHLKIMSLTDIEDKKVAFFVSQTS